MNTTHFTMEDPQTEMFVRLLAQEAGDGLDIEEYLHTLVFDQMENHPATRMCGDPNCLDWIAPTLTMSPCKHVPNHYRRSTLTATPVENCPQCGAATITVDEATRLYGDKSA